MHYCRQNWSHKHKYLLRYKTEELYLWSFKLRKLKNWIFPKNRWKCFHDEIISQKNLQSSRARFVFLLELAERWLGSFSLSLLCTNLFILWQSKNYTHSLHLTHRLRLKHCINTTLFFYKWANPGLFFIYFWSFQKTIQFLQQMYIKISIQYTVPRFEPTTFGTWVSSLNH